jgi:hypothetical protein
MKPVGFLHLEGGVFLTYRFESSFNNEPLLAVITLHLLKMPFPSSYPPLEIPDIDLWQLLFERKAKPFPDDKGKPTSVPDSEP